MDIQIEKITLKVPDALGERVIELLERSATVNRKGEVIAFIQRQLQEARDQFRYYGNLRAAVAWLPAVISITIVTFVANRLSDADVVIQAVPIFILAAILAIIWFVQRDFQKRQFDAQLASEELQREYQKAVRGEDVEPETIYELLRRIRGSARKNKLDAASKGLGGFFFAIFLLYVGYVGFIVFTDSGTCTDPDPGVVLRALRPLICDPVP